MPIATHDATIGSGSDSNTWNEQQIDSIRRYVDELLQGAAFRGSLRSQRFLRYIVEKTLSGEVENLKERTIGVELFQRDPTYSTGQDAIVRVTATEVRRRLLQHYGRYGDTSNFHISLSAGSYLPEIRIQTSSKEPKETEIQSPVRIEVLEPTEARPKRSRPIHRGLLAWLAATVGVLIGIVAALAFVRWHRGVDPNPSPLSALPPWNAVLSTGHEVQVITSDPNIEHLQELTGSNISVSDYAGHLFVPAGGELSAGQREFYQYYELADNAASVDTPLAVSIARLVPPDFPVRSRSARSVRITDFQTDDNLVLIGSPRSNPWVGLFADELDFRFVYDPGVTQEIVVNSRPRAGEKAAYVPTARGFATGESYALVAMVHDQSQAGRVLLLGGVNGEGTEAAGHLVTDRAHLMRMLDYCGIPAQGPAPDFELLLHVRIVAGSPSTVDMLACHLLSVQKSG
ncbi:MAG TPA: hypothetical protein VGI45_26925 [Terracidiphilus sp.]|jgi:hypothetical protein